MEVGAPRRTEITGNRRKL